VANALEYKLLAVAELRRNGRPMYNQTFSTILRPYTESTHQRVVLATNMAVPQEVDLSGVTGAPGVDEAHTVFVQTDRAVQVSMNAPDNLWPINANGSVLLTGTVTHLYVYNESTTNQAIIDVVAIG
jgi:hypothetical protein